MSQGYCSVKQLIGKDVEIYHLRTRIEELRGLCKSASGWLIDAGDVGSASIIMRQIKDAEPRP